MAEHEPASRRDGRHGRIVAVMRMSDLAGFFDGEGCISLVRGGPTIGVFVTQVDRRPLDALAARFGGRVAARPPSTPRAQPAFVWTVFSERARAFLRIVRPYLIVKAAKADLVLGMANASLVCARDGHAVVSVRSAGWRHQPNGPGPWCHQVPDVITYGAWRERVA